MRCCHLFEANSGGGEHYHEYDLRQETAMTVHRRPQPLRRLVRIITRTACTQRPLPSTTCWAFTQVRDAAVLMRYITREVHALLTSTTAAQTRARRSET